MSRPRLSLAEFMIAVAILGVLAATVVPALIQEAPAAPREQPPHSVVIVHP